MFDFYNTFGKMSSNNDEHFTSISQRRRKKKRKKKLEQIVTSVKSRKESQIGENEMKQAEKMLIRRMFLFENDVKKKKNYRMRDCQKINKMKKKKKKKKKHTESQ